MSCTRTMALLLPSLEVDRGMGRETRTFLLFVSALEEITPKVDTVRLGLCALETGPPARFFGDDDQSLSKRVSRAITQVPNRGPVLIGIADGLFVAWLAALNNRVPVTETGVAVTIVDSSTTPAFLDPMPISVLGNHELANALPPLGITTLGRFAALPESAVLARFGRDALACHRACRGLEGEVPGMRAPLPRPCLPATASQQDFWGGFDEPGARACRVASAIQSVAGHESVLVARLCEGRDPASQSHFVSWDKRRELAKDPPRRKWVATLPSPTPVLVMERPHLIDLSDSGGHQVEVDADGMLSGEPAWLSLLSAGPNHLLPSRLGSSKRASVADWAGPWRTEERWWSPARRRMARLQVTTDCGDFLLLRQARQWFIEAVYD
jgi:hypothetical protein